MTSTIANQRKSRLLALGLVAALLATGAAMGVSIDRLWVRGSAAHDTHRWKRHSPEQIVERFRTKLRLTDAQAVKIEAIIRRVRDASHKLKEHTRPQMRAAHERAQKEILAVLDAEQVVKYRKMIERKQRRHRMFKGHGPHGHPGMPHP